MKLSKYFDIYIGSPRNMRVVMKIIGKITKIYSDLSTFGRHVSIYGHISVSLFETKGVNNAISYI